MTQTPTKYKQSTRLLALLGKSAFAISIVGCQGQTSTAHKTRVQRSGSEASQARPQGKAIPNGSREQPPHPKSPCPEFSTPVSKGELGSPQLNEVSGLVDSRDQPNTIWVHNDSGDSAHVYAIRSNGKLIASYSLPVEARDWEDMAREPQTNSADWLYVADIGDNASGREEGVEVHRFREPTIRQGNQDGPPVPIREIESSRFHYPDGPRDAEAYFVDPLTGASYIITKPKFGIPEVYRADEFAREVQLKKVGELKPEKTMQALGWVTSADISNDGTWITVRSYSAISLISRPKGSSLEQALLGPHCQLTPPTEKQGEAIGFSNEGSFAISLVTISEGARSSIFQIDSSHK